MTGLSVIVPCYNEGAQVEVAYQALREALSEIEQLEILFVDDGSTDDTLARITTLAATDPRVRYVSFARNFGLTAAYTAGYRYASQPWSVQVDADLQFPPREIWLLLEVAARGYDVVFGIRRDRKDPLPRRVLAAATHWFCRRVLHIEVPTGASSFRVVRTAVARTIVDVPSANGHFVAKAPEIGARYTTVLIEHAPRVAGRSKFRPARLAGDAFELMFGFSWRPLNATYLGAALTVVGAVVLAVLAVLGTLSVTAFAVGSLLVSATSTVAVAIVGRYLHRRMLDARPRRLYYVREANIPIPPADMLDGGHPAPAPPTRHALRVAS